MTLSLLRSFDNAKIFFMHNVFFLVLHLYIFFIKGNSYSFSNNFALLLFSYLQLQSDTWFKLTKHQPECMHHRKLKSFYLTDNTLYSADMNTIAVVCKYACYICNAVCAIFTNIATKFVSLKRTHMKKSLFFLLWCSVVCLFSKTHIHILLSSATHVTNTTLWRTHNHKNTVEKELHKTTR